MVLRMLLCRGLAADMLPMMALRTELWTEYTDDNNNDGNDNDDIGHNDNSGQIGRQFLNIDQAKHFYVAPATPSGTT